MNLRSYHLPLHLKSILQVTFSFSSLLPLESIQVDGHLNMLYFNLQRQKLQAIYLHKTVQKSKLNYAKSFINRGGLALNTFLPF